ncbi:thermonuclease family protein [Fervidobacterium thailandense]|uniref:Uncharacterized protein n=1 Tax=Fervidobacterium thailandense TaxID=1008305 RepID=A0A1E3G1J7_9BACT|nr:thermonuclease family protein [Fervidobacterium thailandense]ODN30115.1 hypothetical protein A4H02_07375 [Fervidobacterium thailandense]
MRRAMIGLILSLTVVLFSNFVFDESSLKKAFVESVIDNETFIAIVDGNKIKVKLLGVDVEDWTMNYYGAQALKLLQQTINKIVYLEFDNAVVTSDVEVFAYVWLELPNTIQEQGKTYVTQEEISSKMLNALLIVNGLAYPEPLFAGLKYIKVFEGLEKYARTNLIGVWKNYYAPPRVSVFVTPSLGYYHVSTCPLLQTINWSFIADYLDAQAMGYKPCPLCRPKK